MSESMAFIGGVAVAGLAALLLLKGTNTPIQTNFAAPQMPATVVAPQVMPPWQYPNAGQPVYPNQPPTAPSTTQAAETEKLNSINMAMEKLRTDNEQLKLQNQQFQWQLQQLQTQSLQPTKLAALPAQTTDVWWRTPIIWAVGGATLTIGGGIVVAGVLSLFSPKQRPTRTVQVIHPYNGPTPPLAPVRRAEFLPSRAEARRVEATEYDEMH
jgi:hypothetical protein